MFPSIARALLVALVVASPAAADHGIRVTALTASNELAVVDLKADGIGSGQAQAQTAAGSINVDVSKLQMMPDGMLLYNGDNAPGQVLELMGGTLMDMNNFDQRLAAILTGKPVPPMETVNLYDSTPRADQPSPGFEPASAMAALPVPGPGAPRKTYPAPAPPPGSSSGGGQVKGRSFHVYATSEGLIGQGTADGTTILQWTEGVALPSRKALERGVHVTYQNNGRGSDAKVLDVGPWNTNDPYWEGSGVPQAASGVDRTGRRTNRAGIDLMDAVWYTLLGLHSFDRGTLESISGWVTWGFTN